MESEHTLWSREARHRNSQQRVVRRALGVESPALREEPGHRQARVAREPVVRVDYDRRSAPADPSGRTVVGREGSAEAHAPRNRDDGQARGCESAAISVLRPHQVRRMRCRLDHGLCEPAFVLRSSRPGDVLEQAHDSPGRSRSASAEGASGEAATSGPIRGVLRRVHARDEPAPDGTSREALRGRTRARTRAEGHSSPHPGNQERFNRSGSQSRVERPAGAEDRAPSETRISRRAPAAPASRNGGAISAEGH